MQRSTYWRRYLVVGVLSLLKAVAVRRNQGRFKKELADAGLFIGLAALIRYVEGSGDSSSQRAAWLDSAAQRVTRRNGATGRARIDDFIDQQDLQRLYRERVAPRVRGESTEETIESKPSLRERLRSR